MQIASESHSAICDRCLPFFASQVPWIRLQLGLDAGGIPHKFNTPSSFDSSATNDSEISTRSHFRPAPEPVLSPCARHVLLLLLQVRTMNTFKLCGDAGSMLFLLHFLQWLCHYLFPINLSLHC